MATVLEERTAEEQHSIVPFLWAKYSIHRIYLKKSGSQLGGIYFADDEDVETEVRKWLRQQTKDFYAAGFDTLVKR
jgi:hypothetical protein